MCLKILSFHTATVYSNPKSKISISKCLCFSCSSKGTEGIKVSTDEDELEEPEESWYLNLPSLDILYYHADSAVKLSAFCDAKTQIREQVPIVGATGRSLNVYYVFLGKNLVSWKTKKQKIVSISYAEESQAAK